MKKISIAVIGSTLFIAGYYQAKKQTEYMMLKAASASPATPAKPMIIPIKTPPTFAFRLDRAFVSNK